MPLVRRRMLIGGWRSPIERRRGIDFRFALGSRPGLFSVRRLPEIIVSGGFCHVCSVFCFGFCCWFWLLWLVGSALCSRSVGLGVGRFVQFLCRGGSVCSSLVRSGGSLCGGSSGCCGLGRLSSGSGLGFPGGPRPPFFVEKGGTLRFLHLLLTNKQQDFNSSPSI